MNDNSKFTSGLSLIYLPFKDPSIGQLVHTGYPKLYPGVQVLMDFSGSLGGDIRIPKIAILTTINHSNSILTQLWTAKGALSALSA